MVAFPEVVAPACVSGRAVNPGLLVKGFGGGKKEKAISVQLITKDHVMRSRDQPRNGT
jgi:hypothetical protein